MVLIGGVMCQTESKGVDWGSDVPKRKGQRQLICVEWGGGVKL